MGLANRMLGWCADEKRMMSCCLLYQPCTVHFVIRMCCYAVLYARYDAICCARAVCCEDEYIQNITKIMVGKQGNQIWRLATVDFQLVH